jgi:hypothetical protein
MIELSIPQVGEESKNAKDMIFSVLTEKQPLTTMQIFNTIKRKYNAGLSYQAINKAINSLVDKKVLIKEKKYYNINQEWLTQVKIMVDKLLTTNKSEQQIIKFNKDLAHKDYAIYTFTNLYDLDTFWDDMLIYLADNIKNEEEKIFLAHAHYGWWLLINLGKETKMFQHLISKKIKCYNLFIGKYPLNIWAEKIYKDMGVTFRVTEDKEVDESITLNVIGDTIIQVHYPEKILQKLRSFYKKYKTTQEMSMKEISEIAHEQCELKFIIFKNKEIAQSLRDKYVKKFKKSK